MCCTSICDLRSKDNGASHNARVIEVALLSFLKADEVVITAGSAAKYLVGLMGYRLPTLNGTFFHIETRHLRQDVLDKGLAQMKDFIVVPEESKVHFFSPLILKSTRFQTDPMVAI